MPVRAILEDRFLRTIINDTTTSKWASRRGETGVLGKRKGLQVSVRLDIFTGQELAPAFSGMLFLTLYFPFVLLILHEFHTTSF